MSVSASCTLAQLRAVAREYHIWSRLCDVSCMVQVEETPEGLLVHRAASSCALPAFSRPGSVRLQELTGTLCACLLRGDATGRLGDSSKLQQSLFVVGVSLVQLRFWVAALEAAPALETWRHVARIAGAGLSFPALRPLQRALVVQQESVVWLQDLVSQVEAEIVCIQKVLAGTAQHSALRAAKMETFAADEAVAFLSQDPTELLVGIGASAIPDDVSWEVRELLLFGLVHEDIHQGVLFYRLPRGAFEWLLREFPPEAGPGLQGTVWTKSLPWADLAALWCPYAEGDLRVLARARDALTLL